MYFSQMTIKIVDFFLFFKMQETQLQSKTEIEYITKAFKVILLLHFV